MIKLKLSSKNWVKQENLQVGKVYVVTAPNKDRNNCSFVIYMGEEGNAHLFYKFHSLTGEYKDISKKYRDYKIEIPDWEWTKRSIQVHYNYALTHDLNKDNLLVYIENEISSLIDIGIKSVEELKTWYLTNMLKMCNLPKIF